MALTKSDKNEIERISRAQIKEFLKKTTFKNTVIDLVEKELSSSNGKFARAHKKSVADISAKVLIELYKVFWLRRSFWENQIKNVN